MKSTTIIEPLRKRVIRAAIQFLSGHAASQLIRLSGNMVMTRVLVPEAFGVMAIANTILFGVILFTEFGIKQNIIQSEHGNKEIFLNTAWTLQILRGFIIWSFVVLIGIGIYVAKQHFTIPSDSVYADPVLPYVIAVLAFSFLIGGFESTNTALHSRDINLLPVIKLELTGQIVSLAVMVSAGLAFKSIWALVSGALVLSLYKTFFSHFLLDGPKNRFQLDSNSVREIINFGIWMLIGSILVFIATNGDKLILSGYFDANLMGQYAIALLVLNALKDAVVKTASSVIMPALSEIARGNKKKLKEVFYKSRFPIDIGTSFIAGMLFFSGGELMALLFDDRYQFSGVIIEIIGLSLIFERFSIANQCIIAIGKPRSLIPVVLTRVIILLIGIPYSISLFGEVGALWVVACGRIVTIPVLFIIMYRYKIFSIGKELNRALLSAVFFFLSYGVHVLISKINILLN
ncbi:MAG: oligosaccharide flippase family protein [Candidatus Sedimenticola sp. (ex Thyasira tokunagai)]